MYKKPAPEKLLSQFDFTTYLEMLQRVIPNFFKQSNLFWRVSCVDRIFKFLDPFVSFFTILYPMILIAVRQEVNTLDKLVVVHLLEFAMKRAL